MRKSFLIHTDSLSILGKLTDEQAGKLFKAISAYNNNAELPEMDFAMQIAFEPFKNQFIRDNEKYVNRCRANSENVKIRWDTNDTNRINRIRNIRTHTKHTDSDNDNECDNVNNVTVNANALGATKQKTYIKFIAPTVDQVSAYAAEIGKSIDADRFVDYYTAKGWLVGKSPMKNWQAAIRNWCKDKQPTQTTSKSTDNDGYYQARALPTPKWIVDLAKKKEV